ncbi:retrovirus-related pol polyprotein from transposon TNT 1-94 [Tanacetum coccineum]
MACDVSWKSRLTKLSDENVLLKDQVDSVVQERENIKLKYQTLFNSIKATWVQHQRKDNDLIKNVNRNTYAYGDVRSQNQDLLMIISELKDKIKTIEKGKNVNTKFDKSETVGKLLYVTPLNRNTSIKAKRVSNTKIKADRSKPVTSHSTPKNNQSLKQSANVITRGMYRITKTETRTPITKTNIYVSNSTSVESSNSVRRPESKDTKLKKRVLKNTNVKSTSTNVRKFSSSVSIVSNKRESINLTICQLNANVLKAKTVNAVNDGSNVVCVSCGKDVFMLSHEKCVARYVLSVDSRVKRALFTSLVAAQSRNLGATSVVVKSRFSVAKTPTATNKVIQLVLWIVDSGCSKHITGNLQLLRNFLEKFIGTIHLGNDHFATITWICRLCLRKSHDMSRILQGEDLLTGSCDSNLYTISISELAASSSVCLMSKATSTKSGLWHRRLSFEFWPSKKASFPLKLVLNDYSRYTYVFFLHTKDEAPDMIINFITQIQQSLQAQVLKVRFDNGTEFKNEKLRTNRTLVEAARTMLIFSKTLEFLWAEAIATACFTQNRSLVYTRYNKIPYELIKGRKPNVQYFHVFGSLCYPTNDRDDLGKMKPKADIVPSKEDLDNLFGPLYEEYYATSTPEVSDDSAANTLPNEDTPSSSSIVVEEDEAP